MRLQILPLPAASDQYPFVLVMDEVKTREADSVRAGLEELRDRVGARAVLVFEDSIDLV